MTVWFIPIASNFCQKLVCAIENILEVYQRTYKDDEVLICMDDTSKQHVKETRIPLKMKAESPEKFDYGVLSRQYFNRRIPNQEILRTEITAWQEQRNNEATCVNWQFTTEDARAKLLHFPVI